MLTGRTTKKRSNKSPVTDVRGNYFASMMIASYYIKSNKFQFFCYLFSGCDAHLNLKFYEGLWSYTDILHLVFFSTVTWINRPFSNTDLLSASELCVLPSTDSL